MAETTQRFDGLRILLFLLTWILGGLSAWELGGKNPDGFHPISALILFVATVLVGYMAVKRYEPAGRKQAVLELVGLVMITGFMAVIVHPVMDGARQSSKQAECLSAEKQLLLFQIMYEDDNDDRLPAKENWRTVTNERGHTTQLRCPLGRTKWTYAMTSQMSRLKGSQIADPANTIQLFESGGDKPDISGGEAAFVNRHDGRGTVGLADGHATWYPDAKLTWNP